MTEKEFRKLRRYELIEIIYALQENEKKLQEENEALKEELAQRKIMIENAGSLADVCARISGLFEAAQAAADEYIFQLQNRSTQSHEAAGENGEV